MLISDLIISTPTGNRLDLPTHRATNVTVQQTKHGYGSISFDLPIAPAQLVLLYGNPRVLDISLKHAGTLFNGRLEDIQIKAETVTFTALGYWRAFSDINYSAMWSVTKLDDFTSDWIFNGSATPATNRWFDINISNDIVTIGLVKNSLIVGGSRAQVAYAIPYNSLRQITAAMCEFEFKASANTTLRISQWSNTYPYGLASANIGSIVGNGAVQRAAFFFAPMTPCDVLSFGLEGALQNYAGETGAEYVKFSHIRILSDHTTNVNTTLTVLRAGGTGVTLTVVTTANMYIGQEIGLYDNPSGKGEVVIVLSIPTATTFTADLVNAPVGGYTVGTLVFGFALNPHQIVNGIISYTNGINSTQISSNTGLVQPTVYDLLNEVYVEENPGEIIDYLCDVGNGLVQYEAGIYEDKRVFFRARNSTARTWYIDYEDPDIRTSLDKLYNSYYASYKNRDNITLHTATSTDSTSVTKYGITRQNNVEVKTTSVTLANKQRDLALSTNKTILPQADVVVSKVWINSGSIGRLEDVRPGDYIIAMNLPPIALGTDLDLLRTFRVVETQLDFDAGLLTLVPEVLLPSIVRQVATLLTQ